MKLFGFHKVVMTLDLSMVMNRTEALERTGIFEMSFGYLMILNIVQLLVFMIYS